MIQFITDLDPDKLNLAYNNNVVKYFSTSSEVVLRSEITFDSNTITLFPDPNQQFYYNFKELITTLMNVNNFKDDVSPDLDTSYIYDWSSRVHKNTDITFTVFLGDNTTETATRDIHWLSGFVQLRNYKQTYPDADVLVDETILLQKKINDSYYDHFIKYWAGYPFDITIFSTNPSLYVKNNTNAIDSFFTITGNVTRLFFSDGRTDTSIEDVIPLQEGFNDLTIDNDFNILSEKITGNCDNKHYVKWINSFGGWSYWLFDKGNEITKTKDEGLLFNDYENLADTISPLVSIGRSSQNNIQLRTEGLTEFEKVLLSDLFDSAKVYLFTGIPFSKNSFNDWMEVTVEPGTFKVVNARGNLYNFNLSLELPNNVTRLI